MTTNEMEQYSGCILERVLTDKVLNVVTVSTGQGKVKMLLLWSLPWGKFP